MTTSVLGDAFAHHAWATERLIDACTALTPEQLTSPAPGTYGSIMDTFRHLADGENFYVSVVTGDPTDPIGEEASLAHVRSVIASDGEVWAELLSGEIDPDADVEDIDEGWEFHAPMGVRLAQVIHHGTDHRSQICTALTSFGLTPPEIDLWAFAEATGRSRAVPAPAP